MRDRRTWQAFFRSATTVPFVEGLDKRLAALRRKTADFTVHDRFRAQVGLKVEPGTATVLPVGRRGRKTTFAFALRRRECAVVEI